MTTIGQREPVTQNRVVALFRDELGHHILGDWTDRAGNIDIADPMLSADLKQAGYSPERASGAIYLLHVEPTIRPLLCKTKNRPVAEYAVSGITKPMVGAEYQLVLALPEPLDTKLPTIEQLERELGGVLGEGDGDG